MKNDYGDCFKFKLLSLLAFAKAFARRKLPESVSFGVVVCVVLLSHAGPIFEIFILYAFAIVSSLHHFVLLLPFLVGFSAKYHFFPTPTIYRF